MAKREKNVDASSNNGFFGNLLTTILGSFVAVMLTLVGGAVYTNSVNVQEKLSLLSKMISDKADADAYFLHACGYGNKEEISNDFSNIRIHLSKLKDQVYSVGRLLSLGSYCDIAEDFSKFNAKIINNRTSACTVAQTQDNNQWINKRNRIQDSLLRDIKSHRGFFQSIKEYFVNSQLGHYKHSMCRPSPE